MSATRRRWPGLPVRPRGQKVTAEQARQMWQRAPVAATTGLPIGTDPQTGSPVSGDPVTWARAGLLPRNQVVTVGPADSLLQRWVLGSTALGVRPVVLDGGSRLSDTVNALGGQVMQIGRGADTLNVLENPAHRLAVTSSLLLAATGIMPTVGEQRLLEAAIRTLPTDPAQPQAPMLWDLIAALQKLPEAQGVVQTLQSIVHHYGDVVARPTTVRVDPHAPALSLSITGVNPRDGFLRAALQVALWSAAAEFTQANDSLTMTRPGEVMQAMPGMLDELLAMLTGSVAVVMQVSSAQEAADTGCPVQVRAESGEFEVQIPGRNALRTRLTQTSTEADIAAGLVSAPQPSLWPALGSEESADGPSEPETSESDSSDDSDWLAGTGESGDAEWDPQSDAANGFEAPIAEDRFASDQPPVVAEKDLAAIDPHAERESATDREDSSPAETVGVNDDAQARTDVLSQADEFESLSFSDDEHSDSPVQLIPPMEPVNQSAGAAGGPPLPDETEVSMAEIDDLVGADRSAGLSLSDDEPGGLPAEAEAIADSNDDAGSDEIEGLAASNTDLGDSSAPFLQVVEVAPAPNPNDAPPISKTEVSEELPSPNTDLPAVGAIAQTEADTDVPVEGDSSSPDDDPVADEALELAQATGFAATILSADLIADLGPGSGLGADATADSSDETEAFNALDDPGTALQSEVNDGAAQNASHEAATVDLSAPDDHSGASADISQDAAPMAGQASTVEPVELESAQLEPAGGFVQEQLWLLPPAHSEPRNTWSPDEDTTGPTSTPAVYDESAVSAEATQAGLVSLFDDEAWTGVDGESDVAPHEPRADDGPGVSEPGLASTGTDSVSGTSAVEPVAHEPAAQETVADKPTAVEASFDVPEANDTHASLPTAIDPEQWVPTLSAKPVPTGVGTSFDEHSSEQSTPTDAIAAPDDDLPERHREETALVESDSTAHLDDSSDQQHQGLIQVQTSGSQDHDHTAETGPDSHNFTEAEHTDLGTRIEAVYDSSEASDWLDDTHPSTQSSGRGTAQDAAQTTDAAQTPHASETAEPDPSDDAQPAAPSTPNRRPAILLGVAAVAVVAVAAVWAQTDTKAPAVADLSASSGGQAAAAASAPTLPGGNLAPGANPPAGAGGVLAAERRARATRPGGGVFAWGTVPPPAPGAVLVAASTAARPLPTFGIARVAWAGAATWQKAQQPVIVTPLPVAVPGTTVTVPQPPQPANPQVAPPQSGQDTSTGTGPASGTGTQPAPGAPPPNQPFNPQNPDSAS